MFTSEKWVKKSGAFAPLLWLLGLVRVYLGGVRLAELFLGDHFGGLGRIQEEDKAARRAPLDLGAPAFTVGLSEIGDRIRAEEEFVGFVGLGIGALGVRYYVTDKPIGLIGGDGEEGKGLSHFS